MTDPRREAVAREKYEREIQLYREGKLAGPPAHEPPSQANPVTDPRRAVLLAMLLGPTTDEELVDQILRWHDAETRALREALARTIIRTKDGVVVHQGPSNHEVGADCWVCALLTPTPGAGKERR